MFRPSRFASFLTILAVGGLLALTACGDDDEGPTEPGTAVGSVEVTVSTSGDEQDSDGYTLTLGDDNQSVSVNGSATFEDKPTGEYSLELTGMADNCSVDGENPRNVQVSDGSTTQASMAVTCEATVGSAEIAVTTSGEQQDQDGYTLAFDGGSSSVSVNDTVTYTDLAPGDHSLELTGMADNCSVDGENPRTIQVGAGSTTESTVEVACVAPVDAVITFSSLRDGNWEIYLMNDDGSNPRNLTSNSAKDMRPMTSRDGNRIVFTSDRDGSNDVWTMLNDGSAPKNLTPNGANEDRPNWFPDGSKIAFVSDREGNDELYVMDADGSNVMRLTNNDARDTHPAVSPDGSKIAFVSDRDGSDDIWVMNADGSGTPERLTTSAAADTAADQRPAWSPDGSEIAFQTDRDGNQEIYVMGADGSNPTNITNQSGAHDAEPAFSPDGNRIAFTSDRDGGEFDVWVMDADGTNATNLTPDSDATDEDPAWEN